VLHPGSSIETSGRTTMQKQPLRRRRSKGTIAGFAFGKAGEGSAATEPLNGDLPENLSGSQGHASGSVGGASQPQHSPDSSSFPTKPCHAAHLALLCCQNAIRMGARTQLSLCPPGRARRELQAALRQRSRTQPNVSGRRLLTNNLENSSYFALDKMLGTESLENYDAQEEDFLITTNTFDVESDEEASSGDEDDLRDINFLFSEEPLHGEDEQYLNLREPLLTPIGGESTLSNPNGAPMSMGANSMGKLAFNRRKIKYFDTISAVESTVARSYLKQESKRSRKRNGLLLTRHLRRVQRQERRLKQKQLETTDSTDDVSDEDEDPEEKALLSGISQFQTPMTSALGAALLIESLEINPLESIEGMSKCYDGIIAAGVALFDAQSRDPTFTDEEDKNRPSRSEIMAALAPVLITSLDQASGEVILMLAKLRRNCGTARYQRRFVQRVAPSLIRPPRGAMWCLRHQNDMEAILAAAELIFDSAFDIFSKGWYERGRLLLADSKRAETLNTAAMQLRNLSSEPWDGLALGLNGAHGNRRRLMAMKKEVTTSSPSEHLAEWEVIAVDRQIRVSISNVMSMDWSRATNQSDIPKYRRNTPVGAKRTVGLHQTGEMSPKSISSSPRSPGRAMLMSKTPASPPHMPPSSAFDSGSDRTDTALGLNPSFPSHSLHDRSSSPPPSGVLLSPPLPNRTSSKEYETKVHADNSPPNPYSLASPPKSPRSPSREISDTFKSTESSSSHVQPPLSPKRPDRKTIAPSTQTGASQGSTPLSPSSVGTSTSGGEIVSYKPSATSVSISSVPGHPAQYRTLTSTAAERKRTVAACRALRAQITRFEDAFVQLHGRPPKGAAERAPLATTYAQYREWKRAIRADAACRIQALVRGASTRWMLLRINDQRTTRVVMTRAGRSGCDEDGQMRLSPRQGSVINHLSIPAEIGQMDQERGPSLTMAPPGGAESYTSGTQTLAPQWASKVVRRRSNSGDRSSGSGDRLSGDGFASSPAPRPLSAAAPSPMQAMPDLTQMTVAELHAHKRDLKQQLKQYDINFARKHGRMPVKAEKEPIRHLYEGYNTLKTHIGTAEQEGRHQSPALSPATSPLPQRTVSPSDSLSDDSPAKASPLPARSKRKLPKTASPPIASGFASSAAATLPSTPSGAPSQDLSALKVEKGQLHQMLRSYEKDFYKENKRQVSSFADIKPVASQYRRYKEIKKAIAALQQSEK
jgi:hypothetical protein